MDLILLLDEFGYPPVTIDDVYKEVLEQAENFKKYARWKLIGVRNNFKRKIVECKLTGLLENKVIENRESISIKSNAFSEISI